MSTKFRRSAIPNKVQKKEEPKQVKTKKKKGRVLKINSEFKNPSLKQSRVKKTIKQLKWEIKQKKKRQEHQKKMDEINKIKEERRKKQLEKKNNAPPTIPYTNPRMKRKHKKVKPEPAPFVPELEKKAFEEMDLPEFAIDPKRISKNGKKVVHDIPKLREHIHNALNEYRAQKQLKKVAYTAELGEIAQLHAEKLASKTIPFGHHRLVQRTRNYRLNNTCYRLFENAIKIQMSSHDYEDIGGFITEGWSNSASHKFALDYPHINRHGVGVVVYNDIYVITALYAHIRPHNARPVPKKSKHYRTF